MDEAAAAARAAVDAGPSANNGVPAEDNTPTMPMTATTHAMAPWRAEEDAEEGGFSSDLDIGMPGMAAPSSGGLDADELTAAAARAEPAAEAAVPRGKGPARRPVSAPPGREDPLTSYREQFEKAKCVPLPRVRLALEARPGPFCCAQALTGLRPAKSHSAPLLGKPHCPADLHKSAIHRRMRHCKTTFCSKGCAPGNCTRTRCGVLKVGIDGWAIHSMTVVLCRQQSVARGIDGRPCGCAGYWGWRGAHGASA